MRATEFEFRYRFFFIMAIFVAGFEAYAIDRAPVFVLLATWMSGHAVHEAVSSDRHLMQAILAVGAGLAVLGASIRTWAAAYLHSEIVHDWNLHAEGLVADGPFRYVRNPLYLGGILLAIGYGFAAGRVGAVVLVAGMTLFYYRLIGREEFLLSGTQGESYRRFLDTVPRLFPSLRPRAASAGLVPRWGQAVVGETFMWLFALAEVAFAATLSQRMFFDTIFGGAIAAFIVKPMLRWRRDPSEPSTAKPEP